MSCISPAGTSDQRPLESFEPHLCKVTRQARRGAPPDELSDVIPDNAVDIKPDRPLDQLQRALVRTYQRGENQQAGLFLPDPNSESPELSAGIAAERNARSYFLRSLLHCLGF
ncbi:hypothetical protein A6X20_16315 [Bradyrhizobium elkanii]|nr:hypothetical protein A6452_39450 [Bradyrhizobium elkanii]ODM82702.1 hypothetical protein A6X20_16315 [Bradyrhizobium elkanii]